MVPSDLILFLGPFSKHRFEERMYQDSDKFVLGSGTVIY